MVKPILEKNRLALKKNHPGLLKAIDESSLEPPSDVESNFRSDTFYPPPDGIDTIPPIYVVIYGMDNQANWKKSIQKANNQFYRIVVIEPSLNQFVQILSEADISAELCHPQFRWVIGEALNAFEHSLREDFTAIGTWGIYGWVDDQKLKDNPSHYQNCVDIIQKISLHAYENAKVQILQGRALQENIVQNLPAILQSQTLAAWINKISDQPALIVGAGPSLDKTIDKIKLAPSGVLIIAVDTALNALYQKNIHPHIIVTCDPSPLNFKHFEAIPSLGQSVLAYLPEVYHGIITKFSKHPYKVCLHDWQSKLLQHFSRFFDNPPAFQRGMNVGFCAFSLARQLGCSPIILTGMDLAFTPGKASHAQGSVTASDVIFSDDKSQARLQGTLLQSNDAPVINIPGYDGTPVLTYRHFYQTLKSFESEFKRTTAPVYDATEGGAHKEATVKAPLEEILKTLNAFEPIAAKIHQIANQPSTQTPTNVVHDMKLLTQSLIRAWQQLKAGQQKLAQLKIKLDAKQSYNDLENHLNEFSQRFENLLSTPELDVLLDIALAKIRYSRRRTLQPQGLTQAEGLDWKINTMEKHFQELIAEIEYFVAIYQSAIDKK